MNNQQQHQSNSVSERSYLLADILLVVSTAIFVFGWGYVYRTYFDTTQMWVTTQDIALVHCDVLYTEYAEFQQAVTDDPDCAVAGVGTAADSEWLDLTQDDWDTFSTAFDVDGSLVVYDPDTQDRIQEWRIMIAINEDDEAKAEALTKDSLAYINDKFKWSITDIRFLFPNTKLYYDYIIEYKTDKDVDIAAFAKHLDANPDYAGPNGDRLVLVNPNVILGHNDDQFDQPVVSMFNTQSADDGPLDQWYLNYIWHDTAMQCLPEWRPVQIAVVDNAFDLTHPDLVAHIQQGYDEADQDDDAHIPKIEKAWNHGTKEAGIIWSQHNDFGTKWIVPNAELIVVKSTKDTANGRDITNGIEAIATAYDMWAKVINLSRWWYGQVPMLERITKKIANKWTILVAAAGNYNKSEKFFPAAYDWVIWVSAIDQQSNKASFSNYGPWVDVAAPWVDMLTTDLDNTYNKYNGTSEASPVVAGSIALALSHWLSVDDVFEHLAPLDPDQSDLWAGIIDLWWMCDELAVQSVDDTDSDPDDTHASAQDWDGLGLSLSKLHKKILALSLILLAVVMWIRDVWYYRQK